MGQKRLGSGVVGLKGRVLRRSEQEVDRWLRGEAEGETSLGYAGDGNGGLRLLVGRVLLLDRQYVKAAQRGSRYFEYFCVFGI